MFESESMTLTVLAKLAPARSVVFSTVVKVQSNWTVKVEVAYSSMSEKIVRPFATIETTTLHLVVAHVEVVIPHLEVAVDNVHHAWIEASTHVQSAIVELSTSEAATFEAEC